VEASDIKNSKMIDLTAQFLDEPTFNQLRTIEQLGYVVFTRSMILRDVHGIKFLIQSPKKCCSVIRNSLDTHLTAMREKVKNMPDSEFDQMVKSVLVETEAKDKNLSETNTRFFIQEICKHRYQFDRQEQESMTLKAIKKEEW
jgi:insulysin